MKNKTRKSKTVKTKESKFYSLKESLNLIGKKIFGDDFLFENSVNKIESEQKVRCIKTLRTIDELIKNSFFDIQKSDGKNLLPNEEITFIKNNQINKEFKISKQQLSYTLKTGKRYRDQTKERFIRPIIYNAPFQYNIREVETSFNQKERKEIKNQIRIGDFGSWIKNNNLEKQEVYLVMLGINPHYYNSLSYEEKQAVGNEKLLLDDNNFQIHLIEEFIKDFKSIEWNNDWEELIKNLYLKSPILNPTFANRCKRFIAYLDKNKLLPDDFDKYLNDNLYRPNYDECFKKEKKLNDEEAAFVVMGLNPSYAQQYLEYSDIIGADPDRKFSTLGDDEKIFFYKSYQNFLDENSIFIGSKNSITANCEYKDDLWKFITDLYNKGFLFDNQLLGYIESKKKTLEYDIELPLYKTLYFFSKMQYWTLKDLESFIKGQNPLNDKKIIFPLGSECANGWYIYTDKDGGYKILLRTNDHCNIKKIDQFYPKEGEGYKPKDIIKWLLQYSYITLPNLLIDLVFVEDEISKSELEEIIGNNDDKKPNEEDLNKTIYKISLSRNGRDEPTLSLKQNYKGESSEIFSHILRKSNPELFEKLFNKINQPITKTDSVSKAIENAFAKIKNSSLRTKLKNGFFNIKSTTITLNKTEILL